MLERSVILNILTIKNEAIKMIILGVSRGPHDASVTLLQDNKVLFHIQSERLSHIKYDQIPFQAISKIKEYVSHIDYLVLTGLSKAIFPYDNIINKDAYSATVLGLNKTFRDHGFTTFDLSDRHHEIHAFTSFYNSGFDNAICIVKDAIGSEYIIKNPKYPPGSFGREAFSVFDVSYPDKIEMIKKTVVVPFKLNKTKDQINEKVLITNRVSEATAYEMSSKALGFTIFDAGKIMGLSSYGKFNNKFAQIYKNDLINDEIFTFQENHPEESIFKINILDDFQEKADFAYMLQKQVQENVAKNILNIIKETKTKNICLSGGFFLNCVSNYNLLKQLPSDVSIYVEPMCGDAGNSLGAAKYIYHSLTQDVGKLPQKTIYYGPTYNYSLDNVKNEKTIKDVSYFDVAKLLSERKIVAIYQGKSESGPRALGNRSILYDPRDPDGKNYVNRVKQREWFRPFAGSVLVENAKEWFDIKNLNDSRFMMYAVDVIENKKDLIPAITHVDGTCRIQTVSELENKHFYNLINEFNNITGIPVLFNTSFNLAGDTIVETLDDALWTLHNSEIDYLYLPELNALIYK
jgi:carbamoyltransferase